MSDNASPAVSVPRENPDEKIAAAWKHVDRLLGWIDEFDSDDRAQANIVEEALGELARLRTECLRLREDAARLDWLDEESWWELSRTDASDNDGVGLVNSAVQMRSVGPDRPEFPALCAESVRVAIDSARAARSSRPENPTNG